MSDISLPPEQQKPPKHFIDKLPVKALLTLSAFAAPVPVLLVTINLWLASQPDQKSVDPFSVFKRIIEGGGDPPLWLVPVAFIPSVTLLAVLFRKSSAKTFFVMLGLIVAAGAETILFLAMIE